MGNENEAQREIGSTFLKGNYSWKHSDAVNAKQAFIWAHENEGADLIEMDPRFILASAKRFKCEIEDYDEYGNEAAEDWYWKWIYQEVNNWFRNVRGNSSENRGKYAAALSKAYPLPERYTSVSKKGVLEEEMDAIFKKLLNREVVELTDASEGIMRVREILEKEEPFTCKGVCSRFDPGGIVFWSPDRKRVVLLISDQMA